ncbi:hypothetical protein BD309DRAFT_1023075 [Dichomitus squalens]|nr:hypothetical protein BD309DRAFT_1023075 [Dichomitus squalens]
MPQPQPRTENESIGKSLMARWSALTKPAARPEPEEHPGSSSRTILILSTVLVPEAAILCVLVCRHYVTLLKEVTALQTANASLVRKVRKAHTPLRDKRGGPLTEQAVAVAVVRASLEEAGAHLGDPHGKVDDLGQNVAAKTKKSGNLQCYHLGPLYARGSISHTLLKKHSHRGLTVAMNAPTDANDSAGEVASGNPSHSTQMKRCSTSAQSFVHVASDIVCHIELISLERTLFRLHAERYGHVHPEILPSARTRAWKERDMAIVFVPWNHPLLPTT